MYIVGIGIGKRHHEASMIDGQGNLQEKPLRFANTHTGFNTLLELAGKTAGKADVVFGLEITGHYRLALYTHLRQKGSPIHVINASSPTPCAACTSARPRKTPGFLHHRRGHLLRALL